MVPEKPGWYWWTPVSDLPDAHDEVVQVFLDGGRLRTCEWFVREKQPKGVPVEKLRGTWGERLPSSDRLKAMREMAACDPSFDNETTDECLFCGGTANPDEPPYAIEHAADCAWLRSQEK